MYKIKTDGTERTRLCDEEFPAYCGMGDGVMINTAGDWVYINRYTSDDTMQRLKIKADGSGD